MHLAGFDMDAFLRDCWQRRPCLIPNPWVHWTNPLEPNELAGLACEEQVESRLISRIDGDYALENGAFAAKRLERLPPSDWTLLVQAVDQQVPPVADLLDAFRFIPNWRVDDVMVSLAADGGGVGPHYDQYDVFLVQGLGQRRWQVGAPCDADTPLMPHDHLRLLAEFEPTQEWVLGPGDILYVPPGVPHDGVAVGNDCMTYSIGFRAPSRSELIAHWTDHVLGELEDDDRYRDAGFTAANPGEISADALVRLNRMATGKLLDPHTFARWFGEYNSEPKYPDIDWSPDEVASESVMARLIDNGVEFERNVASRFAYIAVDGGVVLFVDGTSYDCVGEVAELAKSICGSVRFEVDPQIAKLDKGLELLVQLFNKGSIGVSE